MSKATKPLPMLVDKLINVYDNKGETADRYTAVIPFDASAEFNGSKCVYFGFNESPAHPMGIGMSGEAREYIDKPSWKHLGKRILFSELPENAQLALWSWMVHVYSPLGGK